MDRILKKLLPRQRIMLGKGYSSQNEAIRSVWESEQMELKSRLILEDAFDWTLPPHVPILPSGELEKKKKNPPIFEGVRASDGSSTGGVQHIFHSEIFEKFCSRLGQTPPFPQLRLVGGVDISFEKEDPNDACASFVVLTFPDLEVVYESYQRVRMTLPYISGFLAFREVGFLQSLIDSARTSFPQIMPQVILVDGNGVHHPRGFGLACHLGVLCDIPTIGVSKKFLFADGLTKQETEKLCKERLLKGGDFVELVGKSGRVLGVALRSTPETNNAIFVNLGHKISLPTAVDIVRVCCRFRVPEPVRCADLLSRSFLRSVDD